MAQICPACQASNPDAATSCSNCGTALAANPAAEARDEPRPAAGVSVAGVGGSRVAGPSVPRRTPAAGAVAEAARRAAAQQRAAAAAAAVQAAGKTGTAPAPRPGTRGTPRPAPRGVTAWL